MPRVPHSRCCSNGHLRHGLAIVLRTAHVRRRQVVAAPQDDGRHPQVEARLRMLPIGPGSADGLQLGRKPVHSTHCRQKEFSGLVRQVRHLWL